MGKSFETKFGLLEGVEYANKTQFEFVLDKVKTSFPNLRGKSVALWGLAFKPGAADVRKTSSFNLIRGLVEAGAKVTAHYHEAARNFKQEFGKHKLILYVDAHYDAIDNADALVLMADWNEHKSTSWDVLGKRMKLKKVFDFRNIYSTEDAKVNGFDCE